MWRDSILIDVGDLKLADLAAEVGVSSSWLSTVLGGKRRPSLALAQRLAERLGVPIEEIAELCEG